MSSVAGFNKFFKHVFFLFCPTGSRNDDFQVTHFHTLPHFLGFWVAQLLQLQVSFGVSRPRTALTSHISWRTRAAISRTPPRRWSICPALSPGDAMCTEEEKAKFEEHMRSLPRMGKNDAIPCEETGWRIGEGWVMIFMIVTTC